MRIFYAVMQTPNGVDLKDSRLWQQNLYATLTEMGHDVVEFEFDMLPLLSHSNLSDPCDRAFVDVHRPALEYELLVQIRAAHHSKPIDLFFSYFYDCCACPAAIREIRQLGIPTVNFFCNAVHQFELVKQLAPAYDYCWVPEKVALSKYKAVGANPIHIQMAANPSIYHPYQVTREYDITFVGQKYADRPEIIDYLLHKGLDVRVWGPGWKKQEVVGAEGCSGEAAALPRSEKTRLLMAVRSPDRVIRWLVRLSRERRLQKIAGPALSDDELVRMYSRSKVSLGFSVVSQRVGKGQANSHLRLRDFEAPMSGALYATGWCEELADYFEPDREVIVYRSKEELAEKAAYYLAHPKEAEHVRQAGYRRAIKEHTWEKRFRQLFHGIGVSADDH